MTDTLSARLLAASREHFGLVRLDPDSETFMAAAFNMTALIRRHQPPDADQAQWSAALATAAAAFIANSDQAPVGVSEEQMLGARAAAMLLGAVGYLLGEPS